LIWFAKSKPQNLNRDFEVQCNLIFFAGSSARHSKQSVSVNYGLHIIKNTTKLVLYEAKYQYEIVSGHFSWTCELTSKNENGTTEILELTKQSNLCKLLSD
jgi:hypothetical protein